MSSNPDQKKNITANSSTSSCGAAGGGSSGRRGEGPCGACKFFKKKCIPGCIFAPYFQSEQGVTHFAAVHKIFGARNVTDLLHHIPIHERLNAVTTICYEAQARLRDPVYGCVGHIFALEQQILKLQMEVSYLQAHLATLNLPPPHVPPSQPHLMMPLPLSTIDIPTTSSFPTAYDISMLFDPAMQQSPLECMQQHPPPRAVIHQSQQRQMDPSHFMEGCSARGSDII
ncbi:hypothetical protein SAY87_024884 [Trapa incisa]|uniref:LOB domain-containing protein n=1 Tax=Trapa incisa TaxID=236973 RepID=A0AAN7GAC5_9MYRT|nr:hypothetical protein SAY87_024884 [Trapa incisa]